MKGVVLKLLQSVEKIFPSYSDWVALSSIFICLLSSSLFPEMLTVSWESLTKRKVFFHFWTCFDFIVHYFACLLSPLLWPLVLFHSSLSPWASYEANYHWLVLVKISSFNNTLNLHLLTPHVRKAFPLFLYFLHSFCSVSKADFFYHASNLFSMFLYS